MSTTEHETPDGHAVYDYREDDNMRTDVWDENLHVGYWSGPDDTSSKEAATERLTDLVLARSSLTAGDRLLDVGCGMGKPARRAATETGCTVVGISEDQSQVDSATDGAGKFGVADRVSFRHADAMRPLPFPEASFQAAWAIESLIHMADRTAAFTEIARVLAPGGVLIGTDFVENVPLTGERAEAVDAFLRVGMLGPVVRLDDYPALLRATGFELREFVDITDNTHRTYAMLLDSLRENEQDLRAAHGDEIFDGFVTAFRGCAELGVPRYMLFVAVRSSVEDHATRS